MVYGTSKIHGVFKEIPLLTTIVDGQFTFPPAVSLSSMSSIYANIFLHDILSDWSEMESQCNFDLLFFGTHEELHIFMCFFWPFVFHLLRTLFVLLFCLLIGLFDGLVFEAFVLSRC